MKLEELRELLPLYALHALREDEQKRFEVALKQFPQLLPELKALQETAADLTQAVPAIQPSPALKGKVLARIRQQQDSSSDSDSHTVVLPLQKSKEKPVLGSSPTPRLLWPRWLSQAAAVAAVLMIGYGGNMMYRYYPVVQAFLEPTTRYETLVDENKKPVGRAMYRANGQTIVWADLPPPPAGKTYQFWGISQKDHIALNTYNGGFYVFNMPAGYASLHITEEKSGGSQQPTQIRVLPQEN